MKIKRLLSLLLAAAMLVALVSCGGDTGSRNKDDKSGKESSRKDKDDRDDRKDRDDDEDSSGSGLNLGDLFGWGDGTSGDGSAAGSNPSDGGNTSGGEQPSRPDDFYTGKKVEVIVPWAAGGSADTACRQVCKEVENILGCTIVINNITGGGGSNGLNLLADSSPDGLTFACFTNTDSNGDIMLGGVSYTKDSFAPVCMFASDPYVIVSSWITNMSDLVAVGADGSTLWSSSGAWNFLKLEFEQATNTSYNRVAFDGSTAAIASLAGGECDVGGFLISDVLSYIDGGYVVPIAVTSAERSDALPDIPTMAELGYRGFNSTLWRGFVAPAGTSEDVLRQFAEAVGQACKSGSLQSATPGFMDYDAFQTFYNENHESIRALYKADQNL